MIDKFYSFNFKWGTYNSKGEEQESDTNVRIDVKTFASNLENFTATIEFEPNQEPQTSKGTPNWTLYYTFFDRKNEFVRRNNIGATSSSWTKIIRDDESYYYTLKKDIDFTGWLYGDRLLENNYIANYAIDINIGKDTPKECIKEVIISSLYKLDLKNNKVIAIGAPDLPRSSLNKPIPEGVWRIDGVYNHGYPYIKRMPSIPYDVTVPDDVPINLMDQIQVISIPHGINALFPVTKMSIPLDKPEETKYTLGNTTTKTIVQSTNSVNSEVYDKLKEVPKPSSILASAKSNAANLITQALNGYVTMHQSENGGCDEIIISETADYTTSQKLWRWNLGGLGFSDHGYDADEWKAAITMDGAIVADRITAGTMFADRIHGGTLTLGGYDNVNGELRVIAGSSENDKHAVVKMDKDGAYIEGRTISKNPENGYSIVIRDGAIHGYSDYDEGKQSNDDNLVNYIHMTNGVQGYDEFGLGFWAKGPIMFNCADILVGNKAAGGSESLIATQGEQEIEVVTGVHLTGNKDDGYKVTTDTKTISFMHGIMLSDFKK